MGHYVRAFTEGSKEQKDLLGGKGANLAEMTRLGLPVPPGFTITTEACRFYLATGTLPPGLEQEVEDHLAALELEMGRSLGDSDDPLLVSVRSGARFSMPGMMETVLDIGLNDESVLGLAAASGNERFAFDSYRRLLQMFGATVLGVDADAFAVELDKLKAERGTYADVELDAADLRGLVATFKEVIRRHTGRDFPQDPREQVHAAVLAVFSSWLTERAVVYRRQEQIPDDLGTAVNVQAMVFGNRGSRSGSGVCFTRDPASGAPGVYGDYLADAQGEDVVAGIRNTVHLTELEAIDKTSYDALLEVMRLLERHYRDLCDIEFTIEAGRLWILQTRVGKRTAEAAFRIAHAMVGEGLIDPDESLRRVTGGQLAQLLFPRFDRSAARELLTIGVGASPGATSGRIALTSARAATWGALGEDVVLVRRETNPDDLPGMIAARGVLTARGGKTSHAAVVARGMGRTCVCGAEQLDIDVERGEVMVSGHTLQEGDVVSIDGTTGEVFLGAVPVTDSPVLRHLEGSSPDEADELVAAVAFVMEHADRVRRLEVRANADTAEDAARARRFGATGVGLCRTEHMFLGPRRELVERLILAADDAAREAALAELQPLQRADFVELLREMDGLPVTIRLIDPPLHEFLPDHTELAVQVALEDSLGKRDERHHTLLEAVARLREQNPMLGLRGVRLGIVVPGLVAMQARAVLEAAADRVEAGGDPRPEIMIPLVATAPELALVRAQVEEMAGSIRADRGVELPVRIGTMIEVPRAALTADEVAQHADFFSFGTNDLTQLTWGFSRDDVEAAFFPTYRDRGILAASPFESIDVEGVGALVTSAADLGRQVRPELHLGVCGEHGGDPRSIHFFERAGLDYVSCSPYRIPVARLEAARARLV
ncbi:MAG TPA: pyruvate, phosphate dikinase [Nocardioides sp.]|uniref:pyruvate, phosphate dikinase n=1 Tax=Nocardioides sp. TaxID=35761 RepID=UPI002E300843|nr:pyruvate, phosphate dikinase [Nocardioides sp.]HEX5087851.1 pyruvate, phosphate dikinase [Nocardioides sp.]